MLVGACIMLVGACIMLVGACIMLVGACIMLVGACINTNYDKSSISCVVENIRLTFEC